MKKKKRENFTKLIKVMHIKQYTNNIITHNIIITLYTSLFVM